MLGVPEINSHSFPVARTLANDLDYCVNLRELEWSSGVDRTRDDGDRSRPRQLMFVRFSLPAGGKTWPPRFGHGGFAVGCERPAQES
jgi:hypothetical protein